MCPLTAKKRVTSPGEQGHARRSHAGHAIEATGSTESATSLMVTAAPAGIEDLGHRDLRLLVGQGEVLEHDRVGAPGLADEAEPAQPGGGEAPMSLVPRAVGLPAGAFVQIVLSAELAVAGLAMSELRQDGDVPALHGSHLSGGWSLHWGRGTGPGPAARRIMGLVPGLAPPLHRFSARAAFSPACAYL